MSIEFSHSPADTIDGEMALELALARVVAGLRRDCDREFEAIAAEKRAALASLEVIVEQIRSQQKMFVQWFDAVRSLKIEARGEQGEPGKDGAQGVAGPPGIQGAPGTAGRDGRDGIVGSPGANGRDGKDGQNGKDALGVDDFDVVYDGERKITLRWKNGDRQVERSFTLANMLYRGVWESGRDYDPQDVVTYGGSGFVALVRTKNRPEGDDWQLFVKRGLSGANGKDGDPGPIGPAGKDGRDATQLGPHGGKW